MTNIIIPLIVLIIILYGFIKGIDIYEEFIKGVKEGLKMTIKLFPILFTMVIAIDVFTKSGVISFITSILTPILNIFYIPSEIVPLALIRPISGSSSLVMMNSIFEQYGPDSYIGRIASILQSSTDTTIYIIGLYFSSIGVKKIRYSLIVGLITDFFAVVFSILISTLMFGK